MAIINNQDPLNLLNRGLSQTSIGQQRGPQIDPATGLPFGVPAAVKPFTPGSYPSGEGAGSGVGSGGVGPDVDPLDAQGNVIDLTNLPPQFSIAESKTGLNTEAMTGFTNLLESLGLGGDADFDLSNLPATTSATTQAAAGATNLTGQTTTAGTTAGITDTTGKTTTDAFTGAAGTSDVLATAKETGTTGTRELALERLLSSLSSTTKGTVDTTQDITTGVTGGAETTTRTGEKVDTTRTSDTAQTGGSTTAATGTTTVDTTGTTTDVQKGMSQFLSGLSPEAQAAWQQALGPLLETLPGVGRAQEGVQNLPGEIDKAIQEMLSGVSTTDEDVRDIINQVANVGAGRGFREGTPQETLRQGLLSNLLRMEQDRKNAIRSEGLGLKTQAALAAPGAAQGPLNSLLSLIGLGGTTGTTTTDVTATGITATGATTITEAVSDITSFSDTLTKDVASSISSSISKTSATSYSDTIQKVITKAVSDSSTDSTSQEDRTALTNSIEKSVRDVMSSTSGQTTSAQISQAVTDAVNRSTSAQVTAGVTDTQQDSSFVSANATTATETDPKAWIPALAGLLGVGQESISKSYSENPAAWAPLLISVIDGFTGTG